MNKLAITRNYKSIEPRQEKVDVNSKITKIPVRKQGESLTDYATKLATIYARSHEFRLRKMKGQFFTPKEVSIFMARLVSVNQSEIKLMDPGAGTGILVAALCEMLLAKNGDIKKVIIDVYENDFNIIPLLKAVLQECLKEMKKHNYDVEYNIYEEDFILHNAIYFSDGLLDHYVNKSHPCYDYDIVISNPPYCKINRNSLYSIVMKKLIYGQPNMYALFMASAINLLRNGGEGIFIIPRSFCSGLYYKKFREWFLNNATINYIHIFESRKDIFNSDGVLQENIILKITKNKTEDNSKIIISVSKDKSFNDFKTFKVKSKHVVHYKNGNIFIRIPSSPFDLRILDIIDGWHNSLNDLGLDISTGPIVPFRIKKYLHKKFSGLNEAPLLWMHNIQGFDVIWPLKKNDKAESIVINEKTRSVLLPVSNYVLLKRFSSKEQKRRLYAGVMLMANFEQYKYIGIENHVNYIYRPNGILSESEAFGIAAILNTTIIDRYFRVLNGNTQVNATDIRNIPFPSIEEIRKIGEVVQKQLPSIGHDLDNIVSRILGWDSELMKQLTIIKG